MKILEKFDGTRPDNSAEFKHDPIPEKGSKERNEIIVPHISHSMSPAEILREDYPSHDWPVSGGWGYTREDACVIELDSEEEGVAFEHTFMQYRAYEELIVFRPSYSRYSGIDVKMEFQALIKDGDRHYDKVTYHVTAFRDADWEFLKKDWEEHDSYKDDPDGLRRHLDMKKRLAVHYTTWGWFDITRFFGK